MEILLLFAFIVIGFGALVRLSTNPRFEKSKAYLLPLTCALVLFGWTGWIMLSFGGVDTVIDALAGFGSYTILIGTTIGLILHVGSSLWLRKRTLAGGLLMFFSLSLWLVTVLFVLYAFVFYM